MRTNHRPILTGTDPDHGCRSDEASMHGVVRGHELFNLEALIDQLRILPRPLEVSPPRCLRISSSPPVTNKSVAHEGGSCVDCDPLLLIDRVHSPKLEGAKRP